MRRLMLVMLIVSFGMVGSGSVLAQSADPVVMRICIHDYAHLPAKFVRRAQQHVTDLYASIGVETEWAETNHPTDARTSGRDYDPNELLVNILPPTMSDRLGLADDALGVAAVTLHDGGRVAYILFDRVSRMAENWERQPPEMLGLVIAHEIGHLLLPYGSHSPSGLMRPNWQFGDFRTGDGQLDGFTPAQAGSIRAQLGRRTRTEPIRIEGKATMNAGQ